MHAPGQRALTIEAGYGRGQNKWIQLNKAYYHYTRIFNLFPYSVDTNPPLALIHLPSWSWFEKHRLFKIDRYRKRLQPTISSRFHGVPPCDGSIKKKDGIRSHKEPCLFTEKDPSELGKLYAEIDKGQRLHLYHPFKPPARVFLS